MHVKLAWLVTQVSVLTMTVVVICYVFNSVLEIEINGGFLFLALCSLILAVVVPIVRFLYLLERERESSV